MREVKIYGTLLCNERSKNIYGTLLVLVMNRSVKINKELSTLLSKHIMQFQELGKC